ncbi:BTB/POZ domain-containing protein [Ditylenchus destructor]|nr:BTB/POZ domain-containing protein [Ditylenchus destructor]
MSGNNSTPKDDWVRLNVGGKVFQTTKDTLSRYPDSFLARLVNGGLSSDKDESGAYLIDADPEHFRTILNYLRRGSVTLDGTMKLEDLLREADFYNIEPLVIEIREAMSAPDQMTTMTNLILAKIDDMSKKLSPVGTNSMTPEPMTSSTAHTDFTIPRPMSRPMSSIKQGQSYVGRYEKRMRCRNCQALCRPVTKPCDKTVCHCNNRHKKRKCSEYLYCCDNPEPMMSSELVMY